MSVSKWSYQDTWIEGGALNIRIVTVWTGASVKRVIERKFPAEELSAGSADFVIDCSGAGNVRGMGQTLS